uniref:CPSF_A domain-containing protein n=1 Tax=Steinernema glaseri TaxID=37863 RepID=A0A1I7YEJ6_9BILA
MGQRILTNNFSASYGCDGLLVYRDGKLELLMGWQCNEGDPSCARKIQLEMTPPIPPEAKVIDISSSDGGQHISVVTNCGIFIVVVDKSIWQHYSVHATRPIIERLRDHYYAKCYSVCPLLYGHANSVRILKFRWLVIDNRHIFAILSDDDGIRFFEIGSDGEKDVKLPNMIIDFRNMRSGTSERDHSLTNHKQPKVFGLHRSLTSLDFGPIIHDSEESIQTVFFSDTEGDIYYFGFSLEQFMGYGPVGPLRVRMHSGCGPLIGSAIDIADIKYIRHWYSDVLPMFAVASYSGKVYHLMLSQLIDEFDEAEFCYGGMFHAFVGDVFDFDASRGSIVFAQDNIFDGKYFIRSERAVALMDVSNVVLDMWKVSTKRKAGEALEKARLSYLGIAPDKSPTNFFVSLSCIRLIDRDEESGKLQFIILARTEGNKLLTKAITELVRSSSCIESLLENGFDPLSKGITKDQLPESVHIPNKMSSFQTASIPSIILSDAPEEQQVATLKSASDALTAACKSMAEAVDPYITSAKKLSEEFTSLERVHDECSARMLDIFDQMVALRFKVLAIKKRVERQEELRDKLTGAVHHETFNRPLSRAERAMYQDLKKGQVRVNHVKEAVPRLRKLVAEVQMELLERDPSSYVRISRPN